MANDSHELTSVNKEFFPLLSPINTVQSILWVPLDLPTPGHCYDLPEPERSGDLGEYLKMHSQGTSVPAHAPMVPDTQQMPNKCLWTARQC